MQTSSTCQSAGRVWSQFDIFDLLRVPLAARSVAAAIYEPSALLHPDGLLWSVVSTFCTILPSSANFDALLGSRQSLPRGG